MPNLKLAINNGEKNIENMSKVELEEAQNLALSIPFESRQAFLELILKPAVPSFSHKVTSPEWLLSDYKDVVWDCLFGSRKKRIDFRIILEDGSLLTDPKNSEFLFTLKYILCIQTHPRYNGGSRLVSTTCSAKVQIALNFFDYLLIRKKYFRLAEFGISLVTSNDLLIFLERMRLGVSEGVYEYSYRVTQFLKEKGGDVTDVHINDCIKHCPEIQYPPGDFSLELSNEELLRAKAWIWSEGGYKKHTGYKSKVLIFPLYSNTLSGCGSNFVQIPDLKFGDQYKLKEFAAVPVKSNQEGVSSNKAITAYKDFINSLRIVSGENFKGIKDNVLDEYDSQSKLNQLPNSSGICRFRTLPGDVALKALRDAFEFTTQYADDIFKSVGEILLANKSNSRDKVKMLDMLVPDFTSSTLLALGVQKWSLKRKKTDSDEYFKVFRSNNSLHALYEVLLGSIFVVVGILMARRTSEIRELKYDCLLPRGKDPHLDKNKNVNYSLEFDNRKSGHAGDRELLIRPITCSGAKLIWKLQKFRQVIIESNKGADYENLFVSILQSGAYSFEMSNSAYGLNLNRFCDYFETKTIKLENFGTRRYYIRQHQLRRFFAMCFFWSSGYDGLDTLRWFLGHTDAEHLWHYITENTPGLVLRGVKAEALVHGLNANNIQGIERLRELLKERFDFGTLSIESLADIVDDFEEEAQSGYVMLDPTLEILKQELESNVEMLLMDGVIDLEPRFLTVTNEQGEIVQKVTLTVVIKEV
jgi:hypothetical protein|tara:strand:- start:3168 stop:5432 length:2265 start_codon:yes stop_codon:yes gene_type:complete